MIGNIGIYALVLILSFTSFGILYSSNESYVKLLQNKIVTMNATIDVGIQNDNIYNIIHQYMNSGKRYKVYAYPDYSSFEKDIIENPYNQKYDTFFVFITSKVANKEDFTKKFDDYANADKDYIYSTLNFKDLSSIYVFKGFKGFYQKIRLY